MSANRLLPWIGVVLLGAIYGVSFILPAIPSLTPGQIWPGHRVYGLAFHFRLDVWWANPVFWLGLGLLLLRLWIWAGIAGLIAAGLGLWTFVVAQQRGDDSPFLIGYWLWVGSFAGLALFGFVGASFLPVESQNWLLRPPPEAEIPRRAWTYRRLGTLGVLIAFIAGLSAFHGDHAERPQPQPGINRPIVETIEGVVIEIEKPLDQSVRINRIGNNQLSVRMGDFKFRYRAGRITVGDQDRGEVRRGDRILILADGEVIVNAQPRPPALLK